MTNSSTPPPLPPQQPSGSPSGVHPLLTKRRLAVVGCCVLLFFWIRGCGSSEAEHRLVGKWELTEGEQAGATLEFTEGGKVLLKRKYGSAQVGIYSIQSSILSIFKGDKSERWAAKYEVEFRPADDIIFVLTDDGLGQDEFAKLNGRWRLVSSKEGADGSVIPEIPKRQNEIVGESTASETTGRQFKIVGEWRGVITEWENGEKRSEDGTIEFTTGGKVIVKRTSNREIGTYSFDGTVLTTCKSDAEPDYAEGYTSRYDVEFMNDSEALFALTKDGYSFDGLAGRWHRIGLPPVAASGNPALASLEVKRKSLEHRRKKIGGLIEKANTDKQRVVARLRSMGASSAKSIPNTSEARRLVSELQRLSGEITSLQRDASTLDEAIAKARSLARRLEQSEVAITDDEFAALSVDLRSASDDSPRTPTPIELESLLDAELSDN